ncbi:hypothetical protein J6W78_07140 [bacterium]|nr:hypothetical protein [bacterium]
MEEKLIEKVLFYEKQRLTQWWLYVIVILVQFVPVFLIVTDSSRVEFFMNHPDFLATKAITWGLALVISLVLIFSIKLETKITDQGVYVRLFPLGFSFKFYPFSNMLAYYVRQYHPVREYGGWGFKGRYNNRSLSIRGDRGLQLEFPNGNKLLIGTQKPQEIIEILKSLQK